MYELLAQYWWVPFFSVPALAIVIKLAAQRANLVDDLAASLRRKISAFDHSYPGHWVVTATIRDGRRFSRVVISSRFQLESSAALPFRLREVEDVAWEGLVGLPVGPAVQLSGDGPGARVRGALSNPAE